MPMLARFALALALMSLTAFSGHTADRPSANLTDRTLIARVECVAWRRAILEEALATVRARAHPARFSALQMRLIAALAELEAFEARMIRPALSRRDQRRLVQDLWPEGLAPRWDRVAHPGGVTIRETSAARARRARCTALAPALQPVGHR